MHDWDKHWGTDKQTGMRRLISNTATWGAPDGSQNVVGPVPKAPMKPMRDCAHATQGETAFHVLECWSLGAQVELSPMTCTAPPNGFTTG